MPLSYYSKDITDFGCGKLNIILSYLSFNIKHKEPDNNSNYNSIRYQQHRIFYTC